MEECFSMVKSFL